MLSVEGNYAFIADGKTRRLEKPKKKNIIHLAATTEIYTGSLETNPQIKRILSDLKND